MKQMIMTRMIAVLAISVLLFAGTGCLRDKGSSQDEGGKSKDAVFDFSTKKSYTLEVNYYVTEGYDVYFEVYAENPLTLDENGQEVKKEDVEPLDKGYTNEIGAYQNRLVVPSYVKEVYIYSPNAGVAPLLKASVVNGVLSAATLADHSEKAATAGGGTRVGMMMNRTDYPGITTKLLGKWEHYLDGYASFPNASSTILANKQAKLWGRPDYLTFVEQSFFSGGKPAQNISADVWNTINKVLPGRDQPQTEYKVLDDGDIHVTEKATIDLHMLAERGAYLNVLAYYCYDTNNKPASVSDIKAQVIALPNAKIIRSHDFVYEGSGNVYDYGAVCAGEGFRLRYIDQQGVDHGEEFPAGVSIGWVLYANGYSLMTNAGLGVPGKGYGPIYSNPALMNDMKHVALFRHNDFVVLSFEDGVKSSVADARDYDDVMFSIAASPASAITPGIPDENPDKPDDNAVVAEVTYRGILAFEDIWPHRGDFDMNDVVVKYVSKVGYNIKNEVVETVDLYIPIWSGAQLNSSFAYQNPNLAAGATVTLEGGDGNAAVDSGDKTIIRLAGRVLDYANQAQKKTFTITTQYAKPIAKANFVLPPYNPFITVDSKIGQEVHLTNLVPTSYADVKLLGYGHDCSNPDKGIYYVTYNEEGEQMPFAIDIAFANDKTMNSFVVPKESECINTYYSGFMKWILSSGATDADWYLHPNK